MIIQHNIPSLNAHRVYGINTDQVSKNLEKLSSGYRINRAGDDAAGLAISEKMRGQIRGLGMAERNCSDAISLVQTGEGALHEIHSILHRGRELLVQASNGTYTVEDREQIQHELDAINKEIDRIAVSTKFNGVRIFSGKSTTMDFSIDYTAIENAGGNYSAFIPESDRNTFTGKEIYIRPPSDLNQAETALTVQQMQELMGSPITYTGWEKEDIITAMQDYWIPNAMKQLQDTFQSFEGANHNIYVTFAENIPGGALSDPWAKCVYSGSRGDDGSTATISIVIDLANFNSVGDMQIAGPLIAHELMHAFMAEVNHTYALSGDVSTGGQVRAWFTEGTAELVQGGLPGAIGKLGNSITGLDLTDGNDVYERGYVACAYAAFLASGSSEISASSLSYGLDLILAKLRETGNIDEAFRQTVGVSITDFETQIATDSVAGARISLSDFYTNLQTAANGGAGSVIAGNLSMTGNYVLANKAGDYTATKGFVFHFSNDTAEEIYIQAGSNGENIMKMQFSNVDSGSLGIGNVYVGFQNTAQINRYIDDYDAAITFLSSVRAELGAFQNRLEHTLNNLGVTKENLTAAESTIRDADMAKEMMEFTKNSILVQAAQSMLAQANTLPQGVLSLLR